MTLRASSSPVTQALAGRMPSRVPYAPLVFALSARLRCDDLEETLSDPTALANSLKEGSRLFGVDCVTVSFDLTLEAEALGCEVSWGGGGMPELVAGGPHEGSFPADLNLDGLTRSGRIPVVLEVAKRLAATCPSDVALLAAVTGPVTLAGQLEPRRGGSLPSAQPGLQSLQRAGEVSKRMVRAFGEAGVGVVALAEDQGFALSEGEKEGAIAVYRSIWNVARYYGMRSLFLGRNGGRRAVQDGMALGCEAVGFARAEEVENGRASRSHPCLFGGVSAQDLMSDGSHRRDGLAECFRKLEGSPFVLGTDWDVPPAAPVENLHELREIVSDLAGALRWSGAASKGGFG